MYSFPESVKKYVYPARCSGGTSEASTVTEPSAPIVYCRPAGPWTVPVAPAGARITTVVMFVSFCRAERRSFVNLAARQMPLLHIAAPPGTKRQPDVAPRFVSRLAALIVVLHAPIDVAVGTPMHATVPPLILVDPVWVNVAAALP